MGEFIQWTAHYSLLYIFCSRSQDDEGEAIGNEERFDGNNEGKRRQNDREIEKVKAFEYMTSSFIFA